jgi:hypothetical protein
MAFVNPRKTISVAKLMKETLTKMTITIEQKLKSGESLKNLTEKYITKLDSIYDLNALVEVKNPITDKKVVKYDKYVKIFPSNIKKIIFGMTLDQIGFLFSLVQLIEYNSNLLLSLKDKKKALKKIEIANFLQITNEKLDIFLAHCYDQNILLKSGFKGCKNSFYFSPSLATMKSTTLDFNKNHDTNLKEAGLSSKLLLNINAINDDLFKKKDSSERLSTGKEILGFLLHLILPMDVENKIKTKSKSNITNYILNKFKTCSKYLIKLEDSGYIYIDKQLNIIIVNPNFARSTRTYYYDLEITKKFREFY